MRLSVLLVAASFCGASLAAQAPSQQDRDAVVGVVRKFFDGMRTRDTSLIRSVVDSTAVLMGPSQRNGVTRIRSLPMKAFMSSIAGGKGEAYDERIYDPEVRISDYLATVWADYDFYLGSKLSHCGVDAFQLAKTESGWKIFQIADTETTNGCPKKK